MRTTTCHSEPRRRRRIRAGVIFILTAFFTVPIFAQQTNTDHPSTEDLVKSAKAAKTSRKKSTTKVIRNQDVKKSKGKLIELPKSAKPVAKAASMPTLAEQDLNYRQRKEASEQLVTAQKKVDALQKELDALEQRYYEENDPNYRDNVIQQRFQQTKRQLQDAQHELADARDAAQKLTPSNQK